MKNKNGFWVDEKGNSWGQNRFQKNEAIRFSKSLVNCIGCIGCSCCRGCSDCRGFKKNPERITSVLIGSRNENTTVYKEGEKIQVVCGCFEGNLLEFQDAIKKTHGDNDHAKAYNQFVKKVKTYWDI